jgi:hypothetical protein
MQSADRPFGTWLAIYIAALLCGYATILAMLTTT